MKPCYYVWIKRYSTQFLVLIIISRASDGTAGMNGTPGQCGVHSNSNNSDYRLTSNRSNIPKSTWFLLF